MRVRVSDIGPNGLKVNDTISLEALNARMQEGSQNDIVFVTAPQLDLTIFSSLHGADVKGTVKARYRQPCSLCILGIERETEVVADWVFKQQNTEPETDADTEIETLMDDVGLCYFTGEHIDLENIVQESLILSLSQYWRPPQCADTSCTVCGKKTSDFLSSEKNTKVVSFGALIKQAIGDRN